MQGRYCTSCGEQNPDNTWECVNCGENLSSKSEKPRRKPSPKKRKISKTSKYSASRRSSNRYRALDGISSLCTGLSRLMLGLAGLGIFGGLQVIVSQELSIIIGFLIIIGSIIGGASTYIFFRVLAEGISVFLDIEANTRATALNTQEIANSLDQLGIDT